MRDAPRRVPFTPPILEIPLEPFTLFIPP